MNFLDSVLHFSIIHSSNQICDSLAVYANISLWIVNLIGGSMRYGSFRRLDNFQLRSTQSPCQ